MQAKIVWILVALAWAANAGYASGESGGVLQHLASGCVAAAMIAFIVLHSRQHFSPRLTVAFIAVITSIAWLAESVGVATGLPFGRFQYGAVMAPFLGQVPIFVLLAYAIMGYLAYALALIYVGVLWPGRRKARLLLTPLLAAAFMVIWDLSMDPLRATLEGRWIWLDGGGFLGVPVSNFVGWFVVTWAFFQVFTLLAKDDLPVLNPQNDRATPLMYAAFAGEYLMNPLIASKQGSVRVNGADMALGEFYTSVASVCLTSMIPVALGGMALLWVSENKPQFSQAGLNANE